MHALKNKSARNYLTMYEWYKIKHMAYYFTTFIYNYNYDVFTKAERGYQIASNLV